MISGRKVAVRAPGVLLAGLLTLISGCGGGGGSTPPPPPPPTPTITSISPTTAVAGQAGFIITVTGTNFLTSSSVRWNGSDRATTFVSTIQLTAQITATDLAAAGSFSVTVATPGSQPPGSNSVSFTVSTPLPLSFTTTSLPPSADGKAYYFVLAGSGGVPPLAWSVSNGALPLGLTLNSSTGLISGTASGIGTSNFTVQLADAAASPHTATQPLSITLQSTLGRNDNITACGGPDTATPISNGTIRASISPYGDVDTYSFTLTQTATNLTIETLAQRINIGNNLNVRSDFLDTVLELLDGNCKVIGLNDDIFVSTNPNVDGTQDSKIVVSSTPFPPSPVCTGQIQIGAPCNDRTPPISLPAGTYYVRVREYRGDGRPDLIYDLTVSGIQ